MLPLYWLWTNQSLLILNSLCHVSTPTLLTAPQEAKIRKMGSVQLKAQTYDLLLQQRVPQTSCILSRGFFNAPQNFPPPPRRSVLILLCGLFLHPSKGSVPRLSHSMFPAPSHGPLFNLGFYLELQTSKVSWHLDLSPEGPVEASDVTHLEHVCLDPRSTLPSVSTGDPISQSKNSSPSLTPSLQLTPKCCGLPISMSLDSNRYSPCPLRPPSWLTWSAASASFPALQLWALWSVLPTLQPGCSSEKTCLSPSLPHLRSFRGYRESGQPPQHSIRGLPALGSYSTPHYYGACRGT